MYTHFAFTVLVKHFFINFLFGRVTGVMWQPHWHGGCMVWWMVRIAVLSEEPQVRITSIKTAERSIIAMNRLQRQDSSRLSLLLGLRDVIKPRPPVGRAVVSCRITETDFSSLSTGLVESRPTIWLLLKPRNEKHIYFIFVKNIAHR